MNIYDIINRARSLREEYRLDSVTPERLGALHEDTLTYINQYQLLASSPAIHKTFVSVSAMQGSASPTSDLTGRPLKAGQLVVIVPSDQTDSTAGDVYRYDGPSGSTSKWTFIAKLGAVPADPELSATSTNPPQNRAVTEKLTELESEVSGLSVNVQGYTNTILVTPGKDIYNTIRGDFKSGQKILITNNVDFDATVTTFLLFQNNKNTNIAIPFNAVDYEVTLPNDSNDITLYLFSGRITTGGNCTFTAKGMVESMRQDFKNEISLLHELVSNAVTNNELNTILNEAGNVVITDKKNPIGNSTYDNQYVDSRGDIQKATGYRISESIILNPNEVIIFNASGVENVVSILSRKIDNDYIPLIIADSTSDKEYSYTNDTEDVINVVVCWNIVLSPVAQYYKISKGDFNKIGNLLELSTINNNTLVDAINEVNNKVDSVEGEVFQRAATEIISYVLHKVLPNTIVTEIGQDSLSVAHVTGVNTEAIFRIMGLHPGETYNITGKFNSQFANTQSYISLREPATNATLATLTFAEDGSFSATFVAGDSSAYLRYYIRYIEPTGVYSLTELNVVCVSEILKIFNLQYLREISRANIAEEYLADALLYNGIPTTYRGNEFSLFDNIICVGDSLTAGVFNKADGGGVAIPKYSYPQYLGKMSGVSIDVKAEGGVTSAEWYNLFGKGELGGHDAAIIHLGVNDALENGGWTSESSTAFSNIVDALKSANNGIKIFIATLIPSIAYQGGAYDSVNEGIRAFVKNIADDNVILIDLAEYGHTKDAAYNNGHLTALGYLKMAEDMRNAISHHIYTCKADFSSIQFINSEWL